MESAINDKKNEWMEKGQGIVDKTISQVKSLKPEDVRRTATEIGSRVRDVSSDVYEDTVGFIRQNPIGSAVGLCALGFLAGFISGAMKKSA